MSTLKLALSVTGAADTNVPGTCVLTCRATNALRGVGTASRSVVVLLPAQPVFAGCSLSAPGQFRLQGTGTPGLTYTLQTSTNLVDWLDHTNVVADPGGLIECLEDMDPAAPACYYRLRWP